MLECEVVDRLVEVLEANPESELATEAEALLNNITGTGPTW
jgi:hypothetical protein